MRTRAEVAPNLQRPGQNRLVVVANRAPVRHEPGPDSRPVAKRSASGLVTALEPLVETYGGIWVSHGSGAADKIVAGDRDGLNVPPVAPRYRLRYVWLTDDQYRGYYYGLANEGIWPLCHRVKVPAVFRPADFEMYRDANERFADATVEEAAGDSPMVLVQDYHFALIPRMLRQRLPSSAVVAFWHIPWPRARTLRSCPWASDLLEGLLGSNIVGFQTHEDNLNFLGCVESMLAADVDLVHGTVRYRGHTTDVRVYPVGVDWDSPVVQATPPPHKCREAIGRQLHLADNVRLIVGIDRLDYTKGINEKFLAVERLLETRPDLRGHVTLVQVAEPSRDGLSAYRAARASLVDTSLRVNARFGTRSHLPIHLLEEHHDAPDVYRFYRAADVCYVGSLHDGMNLVAKEFVCARDDERGVLVLSEFAGAAQQLRAAMLIDPYDIDKTARMLARALDMPATEQAMRMRLLRANVAEFDASWWARTLLQDATDRDQKRGVFPPPTTPVPDYLSAG